MKLKSCKKLSIIKWIFCPRTLADSYLVCNIFSVTDFLYMKIFLFHKRTTFYLCDMMRQKINFAFFQLNLVNLLRVFIFKDDNLQKLKCENA